MIRSAWEPVYPMCNWDQLLICWRTPGFNPLANIPVLPAHRLYAICTCLLAYLAEQPPSVVDADESLNGDNNSI